MTPEAQRIVIAEACGWKPNGAGYWHKDGQVCGLSPEPCDGESPWSGTKPIPNYTGDLNAMHEAEKVLTPLQRAAYIGELEKICEYDICFASAAHRAETFSRALGLWHETR